MNEDIPGLDIRERAPDELALFVGLHNAIMPPEVHITVSQAQTRDELHPPEERPLYLLARIDGDPVGLGVAGQNVFRPTGQYDVSVMVKPSSRRRGIGRSLYQRLLQFAALERQAKVLLATVLEEDLPTVEPWLEREGYVESERMRTSELHLDEFDADQWAEAVDQVKAGGITFTTLADIDSKDTRERLWALRIATVADVPHHSSNDQTFERFDQLTDRPEVLRNAMVIARDGERFVGYSLLVHETPNMALTGFTGVARDYRGRGIALAIKAESARRAKELGYPRMRTANHLDNPAMLAVNDRLGYRPNQTVIKFQKAVE